MNGRRSNKEEEKTDVVKPLYGLRKVERKQYTDIQSDEGVPDLDDDEYVRQARKRVRVNLP
jgi:hypothetical protein